MQIEQSGGCRKRPVLFHKRQEVLLHHGNVVSTVVRKRRIFQREPRTAD